MYIYMVRLPPPKTVTLKCIVDTNVMVIFCFHFLQHVLSSTDGRDQGNVTVWYCFVYLSHPLISFSFHIGACAFGIVAGLI